MNKLIGFEVSKALKNKTLYICMLISVILTICNNAMIVVLVHFFGGTASGSAFDSMQSFVNDGMLSIMLAVMVPLVASEDHSNETLKNIYAKGYSRKDVYLSKFVASMVAVAVFCLVDIIAGGITGGILYGAGTMNKNLIPFLAANIICVMGLASLFFMITLVAGKAGIGVAACFVGPQFVTMALSMGGMVISNKLKLDSFDLTDYWIATVTDLVSDTTASASTLFKYVGIAVVYMVVCTVVGIILSRHKEL